MQVWNKWSLFIIYSTLTYAVYSFLWYPLSMEPSCFLLNFTPWKSEQKRNIVLIIFLHNTFTILLFFTQYFTQVFGWGDFFFHQWSEWIKCKICYTKKCNIYFSLVMAVRPCTHCRYNEYVFSLFICIYTEFTYKWNPYPNSINIANQIGPDDKAVPEDNVSLKKKTSVGLNFWHSCILFTAKLPKLCYSYYNVNHYEFVYTTDL